MPAALLRLRGREPRLVSRFLVVTALALVVAGLGIFVVVERTLARQAERQAVERARVTTHALLDRRLRSSDVAGRIAPARRRQLEEILSPSSLGNGARGATLYGPNGVVLSTADASLRRPMSPAVEKARGGTVTSAVARVGSAHVLRTFLPLRIGPRETIVVEQDQDYGAVAADARRTSLLAAGILESLLVVLCVLLLPSLGAASRRLHRQVERLDWLASHDELTGLLNRRGFARPLDRELRGARARGTVLLIDLERFHEINETIGARQGDLLLAESGSRLRDAFPSRPVARIGDDEFAVLLPGTRQKEVDAAVRAVFAAFAPTVVVNGIRLGVAVRVGGVRYPEHGGDAETLLRHGSIALHAAKDEATRTAFFSERQERDDVAQLALVADLRAALRDGQLRVHYQPQADVGTGAIRGVEALIRWEHPERGLLVAGEFIGAVEQTDLISELGRFVLAEAVQQWRRWRDHGIELDMAVNLSTIDLLDLTLPGTLVDLLMDNAMPADRVVLEITETTLLRDERRTDRVLKQLEQIGVCLAIDDFGTGYSSLSMLRKLPIRQVKIDRSFVAGIPGDAESDTIVQSTIQLAHTLGSVVVAEGVETDDQLGRLASLSCDCAQGYLIGRPAPADELSFDYPVRPKARTPEVGLAITGGRPDTLG